MDNLIKKIEMFLQVLIEKYNHCENNICKRKNDVGLALIRSIYFKIHVYRLKDELHFNFKGSAYSFLSEAKRVMEDVEVDDIKKYLRTTLI